MNIDDDLKSAYEDGYEKGYADGFEAGQRDVQPERKMGMWRRAQYGYTCNQCGKTHLLRTAYCPTCGAEMDC